MLKKIIIYISTILLLSQTIIINNAEANNISDGKILINNGEKIIAFSRSKIRSSWGSRSKSSWRVTNRSALQGKKITVTKKSNTILKNKIKSLKKGKSISLGEKFNLKKNSNGKYILFNKKKPFEIQRTIKTYYTEDKARGMSFGEMLTNGLALYGGYKLLFDNGNGGGAKLSTTNEEQVIKINEYQKKVEAIYKEIEGEITSKIDKKLNKVISIMKNKNKKEQLKIYNELEQGYKLLIAKYNLPSKKNDKVAIGMVASYILNYLNVKFNLGKSKFQVN